ncbi:MAG: BatD family protein [Spongiibacteraceae bacterium]
MVNQHSLFATLIWILLSGLSLTVNADPIASIDRSVIAIDDTLTLTIRVNKAGSFDSPDLSALQTNFDVLGSSQRSRHIIRNGQSESWTDWVINLAPKRQGQLTIPAIEVDGEKTQAITINVQPRVPVAEGVQQPVYLESEVDKESVYIQQQVILTVRIFQSIQLDNMNISEPDFDNAAIKKLSQNSFQRRINNQLYQVHELRYAIFPQQAGELTIPELIFSANEAVTRQSIFDLAQTGKRLRKMTEQHTVTVKSPPTTNTTIWLPAQSLHLTESWSTDLQNIHVGDSITRTITTTATGLLDSQLPPQQFKPIAGAKFYPDQGSAETSVSDQGVVSTRTDSVAIIPTQAGKLELPAMTIDWWNTEQNKLQQAVIPAQTLHIAPALANSQSTSTPLAINHSGDGLLPSETALGTAAGEPLTDSNDVTLWQLVSAVLALLWLATLLLWWRTKTVTSIAEAAPLKPTASTLSEKQAYKQLVVACRSNDVLAARHAIIAWARSFWPETNIQSLQDIQQHCQQHPLSNALMQLDNTLYGNNIDSSQWNGESLITIINTLKLEKNNHKKTTEKTLPPLYHN